MKILTAINSYYPKSIGDNSLRWASRGGFAFKVFAPKHKYKQFLEALNDCNYHWYTALSPDNLVIDSTPLQYAKDNGFDLLLLIPESLKSWRASKFMKEDEIKIFYEAVASARGWFEKHPKATQKIFSNEAVMYRVSL